jgi:hypothetical protein
MPAPCSGRHGLESQKSVDVRWAKAGKKREWNIGMTVGASSGINTLKEPFVNKAVHDSGATSILTDLAGSSGLSCKIFCLKKKKKKKNLCLVNCFTVRL